jgi:predicted phosphodiesterase
MKLHIVSDLHLSQGAMPLPATDADVVILAGDIARPAQAIVWASGIGKPVLYVPGNHEFYGGSIGGTIRELKGLARGTCVQVLDRDETVIAGTRFLGATLWTDFLLYGKDEGRTAAVDAARRFMRDFERIKLDAGGATLFTPDDAVSLFQRDAAWLSAKLAEPHDGPTVVITHHAPSPRSIAPRFAGTPLNACFVSDAEHLLGADRARLWVHGHTHDSFDYSVSGTRVVCNPRGYARDGVNENTSFDPGFTVELG